MKSETGTNTLVEPAMRVRWAMSRENTSITRQSFAWRAQWKTWATCRWCKCRE